MYPFAIRTALVTTFLLASTVFAASDLTTPSQITPVLAKARLGGKYYPICDASGLDPKIRVNGKTVGADDAPRIRVTPGTAFGKGIVRFEEAHLTHWSESQILGDSATPNNALPISLSFSGKVTSDTDLDDCFLVIVFFRPSTIDKPGTAAPFYLAGVKEIGSLKQGKTKRIKADYDVSLLKNFDRNDFGWFVILQSGEKQIASTGAPNTVDRLFEALVEWHNTKNGL